MRTVLYAAGGAAVLPWLLVLWSLLVKQIGDRSIAFRRIEQGVVLGGGWLLLVSALCGLLILYGGAR